MFFYPLNRTQKLLVGVLALALVVVLALAHAARTPGTGGTTYIPPTRTVQYGAIRARDETGALLPGGTVNLWSSYETRERVVARAADGERVEIVQRSGEGVLVRLDGGIQGWVTSWFVSVP